MFADASLPGGLLCGVSCAGVFIPQTDAVALYREHNHRGGNVPRHKSGKRELFSNSANPQGLMGKRCIVFKVTGVEVPSTWEEKWGLCSFGGCRGAVSQSHLVEEAFQRRVALGWDVSWQPGAPTQQPGTLSAGQSPPTGSVPTQTCAHPPSGPQEAHSALTAAPRLEREGDRGADQTGTRPFALAPTARSPPFSTCPFNSCSHVIFCTKFNI